MAPAQVRAAAVGPDSAATVTLLIEKARFWSEKDQLENALGFYRQALVLQPDNVDALAGAVNLLVEHNRAPAADAYVRQLKSVAPDSQVLHQIVQALARPASELHHLSGARQAWAAGDPKSAIAQYDTLRVDGHIPLDLAGEYYSRAVSAQPRNTPQAEDVLSEFAAVAAQNPNDDRLQLAFAGAMVLDEQHRDSGIEALRHLSRQPSVAVEARRLWRQALLWQGPDFGPLAQIEAYLAENPSDSEVEAKRGEFLKMLPSPSKRAALLGFEAIHRNDNTTADTEFRRAVGLDPKDGYSWAMLASIHKAQARRDWADLLKTAIAASPEQAHEFQVILGVDPASNGKAADDTARELQATYRQINALVAQGQFDPALVLLLRVSKGKNDAASRVFAARLHSDILRQSAEALGDPQAREAGLREAVAADPSNVWPRLALARGLKARGEFAQADAAIGPVLVVAARGEPLEALQAAFFWNWGEGEIHAAAIVAKQIPVTQQTAEMARAIDFAQLQDDIVNTHGLSALLALAAQPDPTGQRGLMVAENFRRNHQLGASAAALERALAATPVPSAEQRLAYSGFLLKIRYITEASAMLARVQFPVGNEDLRNRAEALRDLVAVAQTNLFLKKSRVAAADAYIQARLHENPASADLQVAAARVQVAQGAPDLALPKLLGILGLNRANLAARAAAIEAAQAANSHGLADQLLDDGMQMFPENPFLTIQAANRAEARGNRGQALALMIKARELRAKQVSDED